jgi:hypothetical protein
MGTEPLAPGAEADHPAGDAAAGVLLEGHRGGGVGAGEFAECPVQKHPHPERRRQQTTATHLTSAAPPSSAGCGPAQAGSPSACSPRDISHEDGKSHACCPLLPGPPCQHLDQGHVRPCASGGSQPGSRRIPDHSATRDAGRAAKGVGGNHRPRSRVSQDLGSLGSQLVHPGPSAQLIWQPPNGPTAAMIWWRHGQPSRSVPSDDMSSPGHPVTRNHVTDRRNASDADRRLFSLARLADRIVEVRADRTFRRPAG